MRDHGRHHPNEAARLDANRTLWRSRRGMLELDLLLLPFARERYPELTPPQQAAYHGLIGRDDQLILAWLQGIERPDDPGLAEIVALINGHA